MTQDPEKQVTVTMPLYRWAGIVRLLHASETDASDVVDEIERQIDVSDREMLTMPWPQEGK